jgi:hypothetical protein
LGSERLGNVLYLNHACKFRKWNGADGWLLQELINYTAIDIYQ